MALHAIISSDGQPTGQVILYLHNVVTLQRVNHACDTWEQFHALIAAHQVTAVSFGFEGYPARPVPIGAQSDQHFARLLRALARWAQRHSAQNEAPHA